MRAIFIGERIHLDRFRINRPTVYYLYEATITIVPCGFGELTLPVLADFPPGG